MKEYNRDEQEHGGEAITYREYLTTGHFIEATFENWESEFLQMAAFVLLTIWLKQRGSSESKSLKGGDDVDRDPRRAKTQDSPWPVRHGGIILKIYESSLSLAFIALLLLSFSLHAIGGAEVFNEEQIAHGSKEQISTLTYMKTSRFWFESMQNWAERVLGCRQYRYPVDLPAPKRFSRIKTCRGPHSETPGQ